MVRILIADDHEAVRQGLCELIAAHSGWEVCAQAASLTDAEEATVAVHPDIAILDLGVAGADSTQALRDLRRSSPKTELLIYTMHEGEEMFQALIAAGARGYVFKSDSIRQLEAAIEALASHRPYFSPKISAFLREAYVGEARALPPSHPYISLRERQIIQLLAEGKSNKEVARTLAISVKTVETHRATVMRKLGIRSVVGLVHYAVRNKIVVP